MKFSVLTIENGIICTKNMANTMFQIVNTIFAVIFKN